MKNKTTVQPHVWDCAKPTPCSQHTHTCRVCNVTKPEGTITLYNMREHDCKGELQENK